GRPCGTGTPDVAARNKDALLPRQESKSPAPKSHYFGYRETAALLSCRGNSITISEGAAGARIPCGCGRTVVIPPLNELRQKTGLPEPRVFPEKAVEILL